MAPPESVPRIQHSAELATECVQWSTSHTPILLQFGSEKCDDCPAFTEAVQALAEEYEFVWRYCDAHEENDFLETYGITKLPALVIVRNGTGEIVQQRVDAAQLRTTVRECCARKRPADIDLFAADF